MWNLINCYARELFLYQVALWSIWTLSHIPSPIFAFYLETASHLLRLTELMIVLPQPPKPLGLQACKTAPGYACGFLQPHLKFLVVSCRDGHILLMLLSEFILRQIYSRNAYVYSPCKRQITAALCAHWKQFKYLLVLKD